MIINIQFSTEIAMIFFLSKCTNYPLSSFIARRKKKSFIIPGILFRREEVMSTIWHVCCEKWNIILSSREQHWVTRPGFVSWDHGARNTQGRVCQPLIICHHLWLSSYHFLQRQGNSRASPSVRGQTARKSRT